MHAAGLPYTLEDVTGDPTRTHFDDIYDRVFLRVVGQPASPSSGSASDTIVTIGSTQQRWARRRDSLHVSAPVSVAGASAPAAVITFNPGGSGALGTIAYAHSAPTPISRYLRKTSMFGGPLSRKFRASDGQEYKWCHRIVEGHEWVCVGISHNYIIARYDLKPPDRPGYGKSGNVLVIEPPYVRLTVELLASLTIMRYMAQQTL